VPAPAAREEPSGAERPPPAFAATIGAAGGVLIVIGLATLVSELADGRVAVGVVLLAAAAVALVAMAATADPAVRAAGVAVAALGGGSGVIALAVDPGTLGGPSDLAGPLAAVSGGWLVLYLVGPARRRPLLLGLALGGVWLTLVTLTGPSVGPDFASVGAEIGPDAGGSSELFGGADGTDLVVGEEDGGDLFGDGPAPDASGDGPDAGGPAAGLLAEPEAEPFSGFGSLAGGPLADVGTAGFASLALGAGYLAAALVLDRRRRSGVATPFVAVGIPALAVGLAVTGADAGAVPAGLLAVAAGGALCWAGAATGRRLSAWAGAAGAAAGVVVLVDRIDAGDDPVVGGALALAAGAALVALAARVLRRLDPRPRP
jgi:hypothetical protein